MELSSSRLNFVVVAALLIAANLTVQATREDDWKENYELIYAMKGDPMPPLRTLEGLKSLELHYALQKDSMSNRSKLQELIAVSKLDADKCNYKSLMRLNSLINNYKSNSLAIVTYLKYFQAEQYATCERKFNDKLKAEIEHMSVEVRQDIDLLGKLVLDSSEKSLAKPFVQIPSSFLEKGVLQFMQQKSDKPFVQNSQLQINLGRFKAEYDRLVIKLCNSITPEMSHTVDSLTNLLFALESRPFSERLEHGNIAWLANLKICHYINKDAESIAEGAYRMLNGKQFRLF